MVLRKSTGWPQGLVDGGLAANHAAPKMQLGSMVQDTFGNSYRYIKAAEALAYGQIVTNVVMAAWDATIVVDGAVAAADTKIHVDTVTTAMTPNQYVDYYIGQTVATGKGRLVKIKGHPSMAASGEGDVYLYEAAGEIFSDNAVLLLYNPFLMELVDAVTEHIRGVAIGTITANYYGFVQVGGVAQAVLGQFSTGDPAVLDEPLVAYNTTPGSAEGRSGTLDADLYYLTNSPLIALEASAVDASYVPAVFTHLV